jgi:hypothetical protein
MGLSGKAATASRSPETKQKVVIKRIAETYRVSFFIFLLPPLTLFRVFQTGHRITYKPPVWSYRKDCEEKLEEKI